MVKTIETRAVISAQDQTGQTFAQVAQKLKQLEKTAFGTNARASQVAAQAAAARQAVMRSDGVRQALQGAVSAAATSRVARQIVEKSSDLMHERARLATAGLSRNQMREVEETALHLSRTFPSVSQKDFMHQMRNVRSVVGSIEEAQHIMEPLAKLRVIAQGARPGAKVEEINEDFDKLIKGLEIKGITQNLPAFERYVEGMAKALNVFGDTIRPYEYYEAFKYGRQATSNLSERFTTGVAPTIIQELGGSGAGTALAAFFRAIVGGRMTNVAMKEMSRLGLVDEKKIIKTSTGSIKGVQPGGIKGSDLARTDPYLWVQQYMLPAMVRKGITTGEAQQETIAHLFSNQVAAQLVSIFATQASRIEKDRALVEHAKGTDAAKTLRTDSLKIAFTGLQQQIDNLSAAAGQPFLGPLTKLVDHMAEVAGWATEKLSKDPGKAVVGTLATLGMTTAASAVGLSGVGSIFGWGPGMAATARIAGSGLGVYGGLLSLGYGAYKAEEATWAARNRYNASLATWKPTQAELAELERARGDAQARIFNLQMSRQPVPSMLAVQPGAISDRLNTGRLNSALPGPYSRALGFGFGPNGVGNTFQVQPTSASPPVADLGAQLTSALSNAKVQMDPNSKATVTVNVKVEGPASVTGVSASSSGNIQAHPTAAGGVGKTNFSTTPGSGGH